jgi:DNA invertase Pin-like site-specific DNA recombinase
MAFRSASQIDSIVPKRVALYLRVSTGRQAAGDVSIPSQRDLTRRYCESQGWVVTEEFIEPGASATDDRRPVFQRMLDQAASSERRFDVICVHSFSRFYRNGAEMELCIRKLHKHGVDVVSITQPTGDDPSQQLMRQIIGIFDEYTSRENGKNVTRAMRESAKQGFWNGATPPLGYRIIEAERRGSKIKKRLDIDTVEAELVHLIFRLYNEAMGRARSALRGRPNGSTSMVTAPGGVLPSVSVLCTASSRTAAMRPANGLMGVETLEPAACMIPPRSWKSKFPPSFLRRFLNRLGQGSPRTIRRLRPRAL